MLLAGDVGGTKTDLAVYSSEGGPRKPLAQAEFASASYPSLEAIAREFLARIGRGVDRACFDVAGPVLGGRAKITNLPWEMDEGTLGRELGIASVHLMNDLEATALAVPILETEDIITLNTGTPAFGGTIGVIAPGTGLGEAYLTWDGSRYRAHASEGGHADFAPNDDTQTELLRYLRERFGHVSNERVCSGIGIPNIYEFFRDRGNAPEEPGFAERLGTGADRTRVILDAALRPIEPDRLCVETVDTFVSILGAEAGNLALKVFATGGIYLGGGIPVHARPALEKGRFLESFRHKGRMSELLFGIPVHLIVCKAAMIGAAKLGLELSGS